MPTFLLRMSCGLLLWLLAGLLPAAATHLVGGELTYQFLNGNGNTAAPYRYTITARIYFNKELGSAAPDGTPSVTITVLGKTPGNTRLLQQVVPRNTFEEITPTVAGCPVLAPRVTLAVYTTTVSLPLINDGYTAIFTLNNRNAGITNLVNSSNESMTLSVSMPPGNLPNSSPVFSNNAVALVCLGDTVSILNNAYDADGDRLSYSFSTPNSSSVNQLVNYATGYSTAQPFGANGYAAIDARTGLARYLSRTQGTFLLAIDVQEFRTVNGREVLLGTLRRDIQLVVRACSGPPNNPPAFTPATLARKDYQVEEGRTLNFTIAATDPDPQPLTMAVSSVLLDGPGRINATVNGQSGDGSGSVGTVQVVNTGTVAGAFQLQAACGLARPSPYDVLVTVTDEACNQKTIAEVFRITVTRAPTPGRLQGDSVLCVETTATYTAAAPLYATYSWAVQGGELLGPATGPAVQVRWTTPGRSMVQVRGIASTGCPTDLVERAVAVQAGPLVTGPTAYCRQATTGLHYSITGPPAAYQWAIDEGTLVSGQGTNAVVVDIVPGATATLRVLGPGAACSTSLRVGQDDACLAFYNVITPDGDGQNDVFVIENVARHPNTALTVFNRWGRKTYHSPDYRNTYAGEGPGLYYYLCRLADGTTYKGWFEIVR